MSSQGLLSKQTFSSISDGIIKSWRFSKTKTHGSVSKEGKKKDKKGKALPDSSKPASAPPVASVKDAVKLTALNKLLSLAGDSLQFSKFEDYKSFQKDLRERIEAKFAAMIERMPGEARRDKILEVLAEAELSEAEIKASRAFFPKMQGN